MKKMISVIIASGILITSLAAVPVMDSSALWVEVTDNSEEYIEKTAGYVSIPEAVKCQEITEYWISGGVIKCNNVWYKEGADRYLIEYKLMDIADFTIDDFDYSDLKNELQTNYGLNDENCRIYNHGNNNSHGISIGYLSDDPEQNYNTSKEIAGYLSSRYNIEESRFSVGGIFFNHLSMYWDTITVKSIIDNEEKNLRITDKTLAENINAAIKGEGIPAQLILNDDTKQLSYVMEYGQEITEAQRWILAYLLKTNFNAVVSSYSLSENDMLPGKTIDLLSEESQLSGDANLDGRVTVADAVSILQHIGNADKYAFTEQQKKNADMNGDGVTAADALAIQLLDSKEG